MFVVCVCVCHVCLLVGADSTASSVRAAVKMRGYPGFGEASLHMYAEVCVCLCVCAYTVLKHGRSATLML